jgi:hypothetical protein
VRDGERERRGDGGVDGVAAGFEHADPGARRVRLR